MSHHAAIQSISVATGPALVAGVHAAAFKWPSETLAALEERLKRTSEHDELRVELLSLIAAIAEGRGRQAHGLSMTHGASARDLGYRFARTELESVRIAAEAILNRTNSTNMAIVVADSYVGLGDLAQAERIYAVLRSERVEDLTSCTTFDKTFHVALPAAAEAGFDHFPPVRVLLDRTSCDRVVWVACDLKYFDLFGEALVGSFVVHRGNAKLALHIMDVGDQASALCQRLRPYRDHIYQVTTEESGHSGEAARSYYHAVRYIRFYQFLKSYAGVAWLWDMDTIVGRSIAPLFDAMRDIDVGLWILPGRHQPRSMICANCVVAQASPGTLDYFGRVAAYISHFAERGQLAWGIDQVALYACLVWTLNKLRSLPISDHVIGRPDAMLLIAK